MLKFYIIISIVFLWVKLSADAGEIFVKVAVDSSSKNVPQLDSIEVWACRVDDNKSIQLLPKTEWLAESNGKSIRTWYAGDALVGRYELSVRDSPNMIGALKFKIKHVIIQNPQERLNVDFDLLYNQVEFVPTLNGESLPANPDKSYVLEIEKKDKNSITTAHQKSPIHWNRARTIMAARFFFISPGEYSCRLIQLSVGAERSRKFPKKWETTVHINMPVTKQIQVNFKQQ